MRVVSHIVNDWQLSGVFSADTGATYDVGFNYSSGGGNINLTGSPDYAARAVIIGDGGGGCSSDPLRQFNTSAFQGPPIGSVGLDSAAGHLRACGDKTLDLAIARTIRLGGSRTLQLRLDVFNAFNAARVTGRNATMQLASPDAPATITNLPFDANGDVIPSRAVPEGAGFGVANGYQEPRSLQLQVRFAF
jgi:hypothetical protein